MNTRPRRWHDARPWMTNAALVLFGTGLLLLSHQLVSEFHAFTIGFSGVSGWSAILYAAAVFLILTQPVDRFTFYIILAFAVAFRIAPLAAAPYLSTDIYRYVWDGLVQHAHISPYRYVPGDPALTFLRGPHADLFTHINRRDYAHTIYPPAAQFLFYLVTFISPTVLGMKIAMVAFEGVTVFALVRLLVYFGVRRERVLLYAWCPLLVWEIGSSGHLDAAAIAFIALALLARYQRRPVATGIFLGVAILIKFYPLVLLPALYRRGDWKMPATIAGLAALAYACYASVGMRVFGFLGGYVQEEGIQSGERYFLLELAHHTPGLGGLPVPVYGIFCGLVFAALTLWCWKTCCQAGEAATLQTRPFGLPADADFVVPAFALAFALMLLFSPHYPWYIAWLVPFFAVVPNLTVFTYICAVFYLFTTAMAVGYGPMEFLLNKILYGTVLAAFCIELILRRWPVYRSVLFAGDARRSDSELRA